MVSPQPLPPQCVLSTSSSSSKCALDLSRVAPPLLRSTSLHKSPSLAAHQQQQPSSTTNASQRNNTGLHPSHFSSKPSAAAYESEPYLWDLYDLPVGEEGLLGLHLGSFGLHANSELSQRSNKRDFLDDMVMPPMYSFGGDESHSDAGASCSPLPLNSCDPFYAAVKASPLGCEHCWADDAPCRKCQMAAQQQQQQQQMSGENAWGQQQNTYQLPMPALVQEEEEEKTSSHPPSLADLPPLSPPLFGASGSSAVSVFDHTRVPGKLTRFLPEGQDMTQIDTLDLQQHMSDVAAHEQETSSRVSARAHARRSSLPSSAASTPSYSSPSPALDDDDGDCARSESLDSGDDTDHYEHEDDDEQQTNTNTHMEVEPLDDTISPPVVRYDDTSSSDQSSADPPQQTRLLPVSASSLLPSRPSTAAIPPPHIKDRLVRSAKKLLTAADGVNDAVQVQVIPIYYPAKHAPGAHKIRLIRVENTDGTTSASGRARVLVSVYAHAADVGGVVERKSNISRLFGKFESPSEKLLMNVVGAHNHTVGQESNILTYKGVKKFMDTNKMKEEHAYRAWINDTLLPSLLHDPLEIGEEMVEIEASTDPNAPHHIKPKRMARQEKKRERKLEEKKRQSISEREDGKQGHSSSKKQLPSSSLSPSPPASKRQKLLSSPSHPSFSGFSALPPLRLGADSTAVSHAA